MINQDKSFIRRGYDTLNLLYKYIDKDALCAVMLTGSVATGTATENSDVDLVIISKYSSRQSTETIVDNGREYQLIVFPLNKFATAMFKDIINGEYVFTSMLKSGVVIYDPNGMLRVFKDSIAGVSPKMRDADIMTLRHGISVNLHYIRRNGEKAFGAVLETILSMERLIVGRPHYIGKHMDKNMKGNTTISKLKEILLEYLEAGDVERFADAVNLLLEPYGGTLTGYSTSSVLLTPNTGDCLMAFVPQRKPCDTDTLYMLGAIGKIL